jgi:hypothetical protein
MTSLLAFLCGTVADAVDLELLLEALGETPVTMLWIRRAGQAVQALVQLDVRRTKR